jgi:predicted ribosome quality control (RQC) complex YloA/Tae2 family protein
MKLYELKQIANYLKKFDFIKFARRVENNTIEINFAQEESIFFDLTRSKATIYKAPSKKIPIMFNAPFDIQLAQLLNHSKVLDVDIANGDKVLLFTIKPKSQYKQKIIYFRLEFTGRYTNAILLDENGVVIEALRHIDASKSYRVVKPNVFLEPLKPFKAKEEEQKELDVEEFLKANYQKIYEEKLKRLKEQKSNIIQKKIKTIQSALDKLPSASELLERANEYSTKANIVLANLHTIKPYDKELKAYDFEGNEVTIKLPLDIPKNRISEYYFNLAKRAKSKAKNITIEKENLEGKLQFLTNIKSALEQSSDIYDLELLVPKQAKSRQKKEKQKVGELFWIEGYKIFVGRNAKENIELLKTARANDIWMHTRDIPGSHVIIRTDKQNLPESLLKSAAKLCVDFSTNKAGNYLVDYTKRKFVKIKEGSNVEYDKYKTIAVLKEGIEIRE